MKKSQATTTTGKEGHRYHIRRSENERRHFNYAIVFPDRRKKRDRRLFDRRDLKFEKE